MYKQRDKIKTAHLQILKMPLLSSDTGNHCNHFTCFSTRNRAHLHVKPGIPITNDIQLMGKHQLLVAKGRHLRMQYGHVFNASFSCICTYCLSKEPDSFCSLEMEMNQKRWVPHSTHRLVLGRLLESKGEVIILLFLFFN